MPSSPRTSATTTWTAPTGASVSRARCRGTRAATGRWSDDRCWEASTTSTPGRREMRIEYFPPSPGGRAGGRRMEEPRGRRDAGLSVRTVETHVDRALGKLGLNTRTQLAAVWFQGAARHEGALLLRAG